MSRSGIFCGHVARPPAMDERSQASAQVLELGQSTRPMTTIASRDDNTLQVLTEIGSLILLLLLFWVYLEFH
jgi:hypothetical protein